MKNVDKACICSTKDSQIKFEENKRKIIFLNPSNHRYKKVKVDGCAIKTGQKCDDLLISQDEHEEHFVELKGVDIMHTIDQLEQTILKIGEFDDNRHSYIICVNVAPAYTTTIQKKQKYFRQKYKSELLIKEKQWTVKLY